MRKMWRHKHQITRLQIVSLAAEDKLTFARQDLNHGFLGGSVLGQLLSFSKSEQDNTGDRRPQQGAADDAVWGELDLAGKKDDSGASGIQERSFIHDHKLPNDRNEHFDGGQRLRNWQSAMRSCLRALLAVKARATRQQWVGGLRGEQERGLQ